jgi:hypothetical protein
VSLKFSLPLLLACALIASPAIAQSVPGPEPVVPVAGNANGLTPEQAKRALDTLQDDKMRAQMIDTLRAIANASPPAQAAPQSQPAIPLTADSLGAQLLLTVSEQVGEFSREVADIARTLTIFPHFIIGQCEPPTIPPPTTSCWISPGNSRWCSAARLPPKG